MTSFCNFFPAAKKLPRKVARSLSGTPASRFARRRGLRNSLRSNSPRPISVFSLAPGSPIKAGIFPSQTLPAVKGEDGCPFVIPSLCEESLTICLRFFTSLRSIQNDSVSGGDSPTRNLYVISNACERSHAFEHLGVDASLRLA